MRSLSLLWKLYAGYAAIIVVTTLVDGLLVSRQVEGDSVEDLEQSLRANAALFAQSAGALFAEAESNAAEVERNVRSLAKTASVRLTLVRADGRVIADSGEDPSRMDDHSGRAEIVAAAASGSGSATRYSETLGITMNYEAVAVRQDGRLRGFARAGLPLDVVGERVRRVRLRVLVGGVLASAGALVLGYFVARRLARPLERMTEVAQSLASGKLDQRVAESGGREVKKLAQAFNAMASELSERLENTSLDRNKVATILAVMVEGVVAVDRDGSVLHMNAAAGVMLQASPELSLGKRLWEATGVREVGEILTEAIESGDESERELPLHLPGDPRVISMHASPLVDGSGQVTGAVVILYDVTRLRRLERLRSDFVANVSHELKTPVTAIRALVDTLVEAGEMDPATRTRFLGKVQKQSERLSTLISDLLTISRVESAGEQALARRRVDLRRVCLDAEQRVLPLLAAKGLELAVKVPNREVAVFGDDEALQAITGNLLDNAIMYTPAGGKMELRLWTEDGRAVVEVEDNGIGIAAEHLDRIFERFYRVDRARSREMGGTGLGLSIVKHFVLALSGDVSVRSTLGSGSVFRVELPLDAQRGG